MATFANLSEIHLTITDRRMPAQFVEAFRKRGVGCQIASLDRVSQNREPLAEAI
jgi:DeoR/GlpR family transcriptional regulator of sugar metabolism